MKVCLQNPEYHATVEEQVRWLEQTELDIQQMEPVDVADGLDVIESKYNNFKVSKPCISLSKHHFRSIIVQSSALQLHFYWKQ